MEKFSKRIIEFFQYVIVAFIVIVVFLGGYWVFFYMNGHPIEEKDVIIKIVNSKDESAISQNQKQILELTDILKQIKIQQAKKYSEIQRYKRKNYLTVSTLNGFYSSLFTAIAVLIAIVGLVAWRRISDLSKKLNQLNKIEDKVNFLYKKKEYADWVKKIFGQNNKGDIASARLELSDDQKKLIETIENFVEDDIVNDSWLMIVLSKRLAQSEKYDEALGILNFIEKRNLLDNEAKALIYHLKAQTLWYQYLRNKHLKQNLLEAINYYEKAIEMDSNRDESFGNLAVVEIKYAVEYARKNEKDQENEKEMYLNKAIEHLEQVEKLQKATFNTYFDKSRAKYLINNKHTIDTEIKNLLLKAAESINTRNSRKYFFEYLDDDDSCFKTADNWETEKNEIKKKVDEKRWLEK